MQQKRLGQMLRVLSLGLAFLAGAASVSPWVSFTWLSGILVGAAVILGGLALSRDTQPHPAGRQELWLGLVAAFATATWFRLRYWETVPAGYLGEVLNFVNFAQYLRDRHFPYEPYAWYAHTLFSYVIAVVNTVVPDPLSALRVAQIVISLSTVAAIAWCGFVLFGARAAWVTTALVATSWWHLWATRNGYHQFLTPFFQALVLGGLVKGLRDRVRSGLWISAIGIAGGLHAYWALYLLPPFAILLLAFFAWRWPGEWRNQRWSVLITSIAAVLLSIPAILAAARAPEGFSYVGGGLQPIRVGAASMWEKTFLNMNFVSKAIFPALGDANTPPAVLDYLVRSGFLVGLGAALIRAWHHLASAAVLLLFAINLAGLFAALANEFYIIAIFVPVYLLAGLGYASIFDASRQVSKYLSWLVLALFVSAWAYFGHAGVSRFFGVWAHSMLRSLRHPQGVAFLLLPEWRRCVQEASCALPAGEPGRDFEEEALLLSRTLPAYHWLHGVGRVYSDSALFAPAQLVHGRPLRLVLPAAPHVEQRLLPIWQTFYPETQKRVLYAPPPWDRPQPTLLALEVEVPFTAIERRFVANTLLGVSYAVFWAPDPGLYEFRTFVPTPIVSTLHNFVPLTGPVYLDRGYHPIQLPWLGGGWSGWQVRRFGLGWEAVDHYLIAVSQKEVIEHLSRYIGHLAKPAVSGWELARTLTLPGAVWDMAFCPDQSLVAVIRRHLYRIDVSSGSAEDLLVLDVPDPSLRCTANGVDVVGRDGKWWQWSQQGMLLVQSLPCSVRQIAKGAGTLAALCADGRLWIEDGEEIRLRDSFDQPLVQPVTVARCGEELHVLDSALAELFTYSARGKLLRSRAVAHVWWESELSCDSDGNLFILQWQQGRPGYDPGGMLLYNPHALAPWLFLRQDQPFHGFGFRRFVANGDIAVWTRDADLEVLERIPITQPGPSGTGWR